MFDIKFAKDLRKALMMFAQSVPDDSALEIDSLYPHWEEVLGKVIPTGTRFRYEDGLYRVKQEHTPQAHHPPSVHTAALYTRIMAPGSIEAWVSGQSYAKDVEVTHNGGVWLSGVENNVWEPGGKDVHDFIWKRTREVA